MVTKFYLNNSRLTTDLGMILLTLVGCYLASLYGAGSFNESISLGTGYVSLILLVATLLIGPINLLRKRKNPVNFNLRRDVGIWCGITALIHVAFSLLLTPGKSIFAYFVGDNVSGFGLFEIGNIIGLVATIIMVALLITSNQFSLKLLKGKRWKLVQRFNYPLMLLAVLHTVALQSANLREVIFFWATMFLSAVVVGVQTFGIITTVKRSRKQKAIHHHPTPREIAVATAPGQITMARKRFLTVTGATLLGGVAVSGTAGYLLGRSQGNSATQTQTQAQVLPNTPVPAQSQTGNTTQNQNGGVTQGQVPTNNGFGRRGQGNTGTSTGNTGTTSGNTGTTGQATAPAAQSGNTSAGASSGSTSSSSTSSGTGARSVILGTLASVPVGQVLKFTTPDTSETAFVIHEQDGSLKAFSGICTHRPYTLVYNTSEQELVCNLHNVPFNIITGAPTRSPARTALQSYNVHLDAQNNIVYDIS